MRRGQDAPSAQLERLLLAQVVAVLGVQHAVGKGLAGADAEQVAGEAGAVRVDVVEGGPLLGRDAGAHGAHAQAHALVRVDQVGQDLGRGGDRDAPLVPQLVQPALHAQVGEPVLAVGGAAGHGAQQAAVDLDHLLHRLAGDPVAGRGARVGGHDDAALEAEGQRRGAVGELDGAVGVRVVVRMGAEEGGRLCGSDWRLARHGEGWSSSVPKRTLEMGGMANLWEIGGMDLVSW